MLGACASPLDKSDAMQMCFASGSAEKKAVVEELVDENESDFLLSRNAALSRQAKRYGREREGVGRNRKESDARF